MKLTTAFLAIFMSLVGAQTQAAPANASIAKPSAIRPTTPVAHGTGGNTRPVAQSTRPLSQVARGNMQVARPAAANETASLANSIRSMTTSQTGRGGMRAPSSSHEIGEAMRVTGQSRNLSMGLLFSKDGDKIEFGNPRTHYKDKISSKQANY